VAVALPVEVEAQSAPVGLGLTVIEVQARQSRVLQTPELGRVVVLAGTAGVIQSFRGNILTVTWSFAVTTAGFGVRYVVDTTVPVSQAELLGAGEVITRKCA
jgi:hypothetical protein